MSDSTKVEAVTTETPADVKTSFNLDEVSQLIKEKIDAEKVEWMKRFDSKNTEATQLKKKLDEIERAKLSEKERIELERQDLQNAIRQKEIELTEKELNFNKSIIIADLKLDREYIEILNGNDAESFKKNVEFVNKKINDEVERRVNERLGNSVKPLGNTSNNVSIDDEINRLTKEGKLTEAIALKNKQYNITMK